MNKAIFILNNELKLYMKKELCTFDGIPCLFLCVDDNQYTYLIYNPDCRYNDEYIIVKLSESEEYDLINKKVTIYDTIKSHDNFWLINTVDDMSIHDTVQYKPINDINDNILPSKDAYLKIISC